MPARPSPRSSPTPSLGSSSSTSLDRRLPRPPPSTEETDWHKGRRYGIVIDAGSSGSRVQIYSWRSSEVEVHLRQSNSQALDVLPRVETGVPNGPLWYHKVEPGISSFGSHPHDVGDYLKPLLDHALTIIPTESVASTPFYLLATAGMRLVPENQRTTILSNACQYVKSNYRFRIRDCATDVRVITGEEEGGFGWIAVNYLMDGFDAHDGGQKASTFGFLDMGGASTQIAFEPSRNERKSHPEALTKLRLRLLNGMDVVHSVFVTTWLGYGTNQARERYSKQLVDQYTNSTLKAGSTSTKAVTNIPDPCLPLSLTLPSGQSKFQFEGTGDFASCIKNLSPLLNKNAPCKEEPCLFDGKHVPPIDFSVNHFIGISEYWYSTQEVWSLGGAYDFVEFEKHAINYCKRNWDEIVRDHKSGTRWPTTVEISRLESQCFKAAWIINILHEGIGIPRIVDKGGSGDHAGHAGERVEKAAAKGLDSRPPSFQSLNDVGDVLVSWTLGKMVLEVSQSMPAAPGQTNPRPTPSAGALATGTYLGGVRGVHSAQITGFESRLSRLTSLIDPMALIGIGVAGICLWFFCLSSRARSKQRCFQRPDRPGGYALASMEEGGDRVSIEGLVSATSSRPTSPRPPMWRNSSSAPRLPTHSSRRHQSSNILSSLSPLRTACRVVNFFTNQGPPWAERAPKSFSPSLSGFSNPTVGFDSQPEPVTHIPPLSITTSLASPSHVNFTNVKGPARPPPDDNPVPGSVKKTNAERLALATLRPHSTLPDDRPKQRLSHSSSFNDLADAGHRELGLQPNPRMIRRELSLTMETSQSRLSEEAVSSLEHGRLQPPRMRISSSSSAVGSDRLGDHGGNDWTSATVVMSPSASQVSLNAFFARKGRHHD